MSFTHHLKQRTPVMIIALYGELIDRDSSRDLTHLVYERCEEGNANIVFDLSDLRMMNSTGLNILINALTLARKSGGEVVLCGLSPKINQLFIITKLNTIFQVTDTEEEAVAKFTK